VYPWPENSRIAKKTSGPSLGGAGWGKLLDWAKQQLASIVPAFNVTNAVKHFKFEERSNRRIHNKPSTSPSESRRPWRDAEIQSVGPKVIVVSWLHLIRRRSSVRPIVAKRRRNRTRPGESSSRQSEENEPENGADRNSQQLCRAEVRHRP
jgi:hypothetical protein